MSQQSRQSTSKLEVDQNPLNMNIIERGTIDITYDTSESVGVSGSALIEVDYVTRSDQQTNLPIVDVFNDDPEAISGGVARTFWKLPYASITTGGLVDKSLQIAYRSVQDGLDQTWYIELTAYSRSDVVGNTENLYYVIYSGEFFTT